MDQRISNRHRALRVRTGTGNLQQRLRELATAAGVELPASTVGKTGRASVDVDARVPEPALG